MGLILILIIAFAVRLISLNQSFWLDEAIGALVVKNQTFAQILTQFSKGDNHPPLYYLSLKAWTNMFGYSEVSIRMLSVLVGTLTVFFVYKICELYIKDKNKVKEKVRFDLLSFPLIASILMAFSPLHVYYSQEARMYVFTGLFSSMIVYFFLKVLKQKTKFINWFFYSVSIIFLFFSDYLPVFLFPVIFMYAILSKKGKNWWVKFILSHIPLGILGLFWLPTFLFQSNAGQILLKVLPTWKMVAGGATLKQLSLVWVKFIIGRVSFGNFYLYLSLVIIFSIPFIVSLVNSLKGFKKISIHILWLFVPITLVFLLSFLFPAFIYFRFIFVLPAFYILVAYGISLFKEKRVKLTLILSILAISIFNLSLYFSNIKFQREDWREATKFIESNVKENELVVFANPEPFAPYQWYAKDLSNTLGATNNIAADYEKTYKNLEPYLRNKTGVYYFEYLQDIMDPQRVTYDILLSEDFSNKEIYSSFNGVGNIIYLSR